MTTRRRLMALVALALSLVTLCGYLWAQGTKRPPTISVQSRRFEYAFLCENLLLPHHHFVMRFEGTDFHNRDYEEGNAFRIASELGREGWELVSVQHAPLNNITGACYYFKRPIELAK